MPLDLLPELDTDTFGYQSRQHIHLFDVDDKFKADLESHFFNLLAICYKEKLLVAALGNQIKLVKIDSLSELLEPDEEPTEKVATVDAQTINLSETVQQIYFDSSETSLLVVYGNSIASIQTKQLPNFDGKLDAIKQFDSTIVYVSSSATSAACLLENNEVWLINFSTTEAKKLADGTAVQWKGENELLIGKTDGSVELFNEANVSISTFPPPEGVDGLAPRYFSSLDTSTLVIFATSLDADNYDDVRSFLLKDGKYTIEVPDVCPPWGGVPRRAAFYTAHLDSWSEEMPHILFAIGAKSTEFDTVIPKSKVRELNDSDSAQMPIDEATDEDTSPLGFTIDLQASKTVAQPCKLLDSSEPLPRFLVLADNGQLLTWNIWNTTAIKAKKTSLKNALTEALPSIESVLTTEADIPSKLVESKGSETADKGTEKQENPFGAKQDNPFGVRQEGPFGAKQDNPFGTTQPSTFAKQDNPFGSTQSSSGTPFGQHSFGKSSFGQSSFGKVDKPASPFGSAAPKSSTAQGGFGAFASSQPFGASSTTDSPFGKTGFGSDSFKGFGSNTLFSSLTKKEPDTKSPFASLGSSNAKPPFTGLGSDAKSPFANIGSATTSDVKSPFATLGKTSGAKPPFGTLNTSSDSKSPFGTLGTASDKKAPFGTFGSNTGTKAQSPFAAFGSATKEPLFSSTTKDSPFAGFGSSTEKVQPSDGDKKPFSFGDTTEKSSFSLGGLSSALDQEEPAKEESESEMDDSTEEIDNSDDDQEATIDQSMRDVTGDVSPEALSSDEYSEIDEPESPLREAEEEEDEEEEEESIAEVNEEVEEMEAKEAEVEAEEAEAEAEEAEEVEEMEESIEDEKKAAEEDEESIELVEKSIEEPTEPIEQPAKPAPEAKSFQIEPDYKAIGVETHAYDDHKVLAFEDDEVYLSKYDVPPSVPALITAGNIEYPIETGSAVSQEMHRIIYDAETDFEVLHLNIVQLRDFLEKQSRGEIQHTFAKSGRYAALWRLGEADTIAKEIASTLTELQNLHSIDTDDIKSRLSKAQNELPAIRSALSNDQIESGGSLPFDSVRRSRVIGEKVSKVKDQDTELQSKLLILNTLANPDVIVDHPENVELILSAIDSKLRSHVSAFKELKNQLTLPTGPEPKGIDLSTIKNEEKLRVVEMATEMMAKRALKSADRLVKPSRYTL